MRGKRSKKSKRSERIKKLRIRGKTMREHFRAFEAVMTMAARKSPYAKKLMVPLNKFKAEFVVPFHGKR